MKEPLADGWKKERYDDYHEALRIIIYWRYDGPHPGSNAKPSREARLNAERDLNKLLKHETVKRTVTIQPGTDHSRNWVNSWGRANEPRFHIDDRPRPITREACLTYRYLELDDLITLCPGVFNTSQNIGIHRPKTGRPNELKEAVDMAIELIKQDMRPNEAAKKAAHHYFSHESEIVLERKIKSIGRKIRAITSSLNRN